MNEHQPEPTCGETGAVGAGPVVSTSSDAPGQPKATSDVESPALVPGPGETPKSDASELDASELDASKPDASKPDASRPEASKADAPGKLMIMSSGDSSWGGKSGGPETESKQAERTPGKRRLSAMAAAVALATVAGGAGGALATASVMHFAVAESNAPSHLEASVARIDADLLALKAGVEQTSKVGLSQHNKTTDRLDKVEKAQAELAAKLTRLSEAVEKLRIAAPAAPAPVAAAPAAPAAPKDITSSITPPATAAAAFPVASPTPKTEVARLPTVEGWVLRDVYKGVALIEGRRRVFEVYAGDSVPGLGTVDAIRKQDGRWVVVTSKGLVVER